MVVYKEYNIYIFNVTKQSETKREMFPKIILYVNNMVL